MIPIDLKVNELGIGCKVNKIILISFFLLKKPAGVV